MSLPTSGGSNAPVLVSVLDVLLSLEVLVESTASPVLLVDSAAGCSDPPHAQKKMIDEIPRPNGFDIVMNAKRRAARPASISGRTARRESAQLP
jgi:hypothetical protein